MPHFLIRSLDDSLRWALEVDAQDSRLPIQEVVRQILCRHYSLECEPSRGWQRRDAWEGATTMHVSMPQVLFDALKADAKLEEVSMQRLVHEALEAHYAVKGDPR